MSQNVSRTKGHGKVSNASSALGGGSKTPAELKKNLNINTSSSNSNHNSHAKSAAAATLDENHNSKPEQVVATVSV